MLFWVLLLLGLGTLRFAPTKRLNSALSVIIVVKLSKKVKDRAFLTDGVNYYIILLVLAISLLFSGPGFLAFDLPL